jgi:tetratricopeptide (TPR) repeat protein
VRDSQGKVVGGAEVRLQAKDTKQARNTRTNAKGEYEFSGLSEGVYAVTVQGTEEATADVPSVEVSPKQAKTLDLTVRKRAEDSPDFFDQPEFTVSGVTDATSLGGHGSDTVVRTRESLAKETANLAHGGAAADANAQGTERSLREAVGHEPGSFEANSQLGLLLLRSDRAAEAIPYLRRASEVQPDAAQLHHALGDAEEKVANSLDAVREYQKAAEIAPSEPFLFDWGAELLLHHAPEPAVQVFTRGHDLHPRSARMLVGLGAARFAQGANEEAVQRICEASDLDPTDSAAYLFLGKMLRAETRPSQAEIEKLQRFATLQPNNAEANYYYALALWKSRTQPDDPVISQAESLLTKAIHLDPKYAAAHLQRGIIHADKRDYSRAISDYERAIEIDPQLAEAHFRLGQAYRQTGDIEKSKQELRIHQQLTQQSSEQIERERHEIRQFVYTLRDQPGPAHSQ